MEKKEYYNAYFSIFIEGSQCLKFQINPVSKLAFIWTQSTIKINIINDGIYSQKSPLNKTEFLQASWNIMHYKWRSKKTPKHLQTIWRCKYVNVKA